MDFWEFPIGDDNLVLARPDVHGLFLLNVTARLIWNEARHNVPPKDIAASLVDVYGIPADQALRDVDTVLASLEAVPSAAPVSTERPRADRFYSYVLNRRIFRLGWNSDEIGLEVMPRLATLETSASAKPDCTLEILESPEAFTLWHGTDCLAVEESVTAIRALLFQEMVRLSGPGREWLALVHAGSCAIGDRCVIFPAASHSGKTTLAATLMNNGFHLLSDDFAGVERRTLRIPSMPFALALREGSWPLFSQLDTLPAYVRFGEQVKFLPPNTAGPESARAVAMLFTNWQSGVPAEFQPITAFDALIALKESGFWVRHDRASIAMFLDWLQSIPAYRFTYSDAGDAAPQIRSIIETLA